MILTNYHKEDTCNSRLYGNVSYSRSTGWTMGRSYSRSKITQDVIHIHNQ
jgi:hypothetical protein